MSFLKRLFSGPRDSGSFPARPKSDQVVVVDATGMINQRHKAGTGQGSPRDHAAILKDVLSFASREGVSFQLIFTGRPLREAAEGSERKGVTAHYVETRDACRDMILSLVKESLRKYNVVVCASDPQVEAQAAALGADCMRLSTFRKTLDGSDERPRQPPRNSNSRRAAAEQRPSEPEKSEPRSEPRQDTRDAAVLTLIDPV